MTDTDFAAIVLDTVAVLAPEHAGYARIADVWGWVESHMEEQDLGAFKTRLLQVAKRGGLELVSLDMAPRLGWDVSRDRIEHGASVFHAIRVAR